MSSRLVKMRFKDPDNPLRGLIIDDQQTMRRIVRQLLKQIGITQLEEAKNGRDALEMLDDPQAKTPDFVICDLHMDKMDGLEFCNKLRLSKKEHLRQIPVIILTGDQDRFMREVSQQIGATIVLSKPVTADQLHDSISDVIGFVL